MSDVKVSIRLHNKLVAAIERMGEGDGSELGALLESGEAGPEEIAHVMNAMSRNPRIPVNLDYERRRKAGTLSLRERIRGA